MYYKRPKLINKRKFYMNCIQYVKKEQNNFIHPQDTSWAALADAMEFFTNSELSTGDPYERCKAVAEKANIPLPTPPHWVLASNSPYKRVSFREIKLKFYQSLEWKKLRYIILKKSNGKCQCCGADGKTTSLAVDHIKPVSKYWHLRLDPNNMQVLCTDCNWGKLNKDETDWR